MQRKGMMWIALGSLGCGGVAVLVMFLFVAVILVAIMLPMSGSGILPICAPSDTTSGSGVVQIKATSNSIPQNYLALYISAGEKWNIPWNILAGIGYTETRHGTLDAKGVHSGENYAGAGGPMQFLQETFDRVNRGSDEKRSRYNPEDAIFSAAKLLKIHILGINATDKKLKERTLKPSEIRQTLYSYNHSWEYVDKVLAKANQYAKDYNVISANYAGTGVCSGPLMSASGSFGQRIAYEAAYWAKWEPDTPRPPKQKDDGQPPPPGEVDTSVPTPYSWGGGTVNGPSTGVDQGAHTVGFDCSALARYAVYQASDEQIRLYGNTHMLWALKKGVRRIPRDRLAPGDLVFFNHVEHMGIYYGRVNGVRWMVEAQQTGTDLKFSKFDKRLDYVGALRVIPPPGMESRSPVPARAMAPAWADARAGVM